MREIGNLFWKILITKNNFWLLAVVVSYVCHRVNYGGYSEPKCCLRAWDLTRLLSRQTTLRYRGNLYENIFKHTILPYYSYSNDSKLNIKLFSFALRCKFFYYIFCQIAVTKQIAVRLCQPRCDTLSISPQVWGLFICGGFSIHPQLWGIEPHTSTPLAPTSHLHH